MYVISHFFCRELKPFSLACSGEPRLSGVLSRSCGGRLPLRRFDPPPALTMAVQVSGSSRLLLGGVLSRGINMVSDDVFFNTISPLPSASLPLLQVGTTWAESLLGTNA